MQRRTLVPLILCLGIGFPAHAVLPIPEGIEAKEWKPDGRVLELIQRAGQIHTPLERVNYIHDIEEALKEHPEWIDLHRQYLILVNRDSRAGEIEAAYRSQLEADARNADLQYIVGLLERGPGAENYYRKALEIDPKHYFAMVGLGLGTATQVAADRDEGYRLLYKAIDLRRDHPYAYQAVAIALSRTEKDFEASNQACALWQQTMPWSTQPLQFQMMNLQKLGRPDEGRALLDRFLADHPENRDGLRMLVDVHQKDRQPIKAAETQVKLAELDEKSALAAYDAAVLLASIQQSEQGLDWLIEAAKRGFDDRGRAETDPKLIGLRSEERFAEALEEIDAAHERRIPEYRAAIRQEMVEKEAPEFYVATLDGRELGLKNLAGKVIVLDFWATWCGPCQKSLPLIQKLHAEMTDKPVEIICMNVWERDPGRAKVAPYWETNKYPMQVGLASSEDAKEFNVTGVPSLVVIGPEGKIRYQHTGYSPFMDQEVSWVIEEILASSN